MVKPSFIKSLHSKSNSYCTKKEYELVIRSYNTGWNYKSNQGEEYWAKFKRTYQELFGE